MHQKFRLFVQKHENGTYTATVPGIPYVPTVEGWDDARPLSHRLGAHGLLLEEVKDDLREALQKWLARADAPTLSRYANYKEGQWLEKVEVELRPPDRHGQKRKDRVKLTFSLLLQKEESGQLLVGVPKLVDPALSFYCYAPEELRDTATRELAAYFKETSLENLLEYQHQRQEFLDEIEVSYNPLKPQREKKNKNEDEDPSFWALRSAGLNLSARAREGKLLRAYRRDAEVTQLLNVLASESSPSVLLVGPSGAGKTALVHEAARRIKEESCPPALRKRQVWYTTPDQLIAGCMYVGQWEEKLQNVVDEVKKRRHLLLIDDVVGLMDAGRCSSSDSNMAQFLKPYVQDGTVVLIGETTHERYRVGENRDPGFMRLFRTIELKETDADTTLSILGSVAAALEREHRVRIEPGACATALELTRRFQPYRALPGKAVQFLEQVAADAGKSDAKERPVLSRQAAVSAYAKQTGLPELLLSDHLTMDPAGVERFFSERLIGQPEAVRTVVDLITVVKAGLNDPHKPLGNFFFVGPTGVGKTEMVKALAEFLFGSRDRILRFDMSEYAEPFTVAKLIGSALGDQEGELTKRIRLQPFSVVLLDEFEKAHPSVYDVLLQVLGEGRLTDAGGRTADFRSAIVIMTSNLGASAREQRHPGLVAGEEARSREAHFRAQVESYFRPEFVNRIDHVVAFRPLDRDAMRAIASRELALLLEREGVTRRGLMVEIEDDVLDLLLETGFSPTYGARPLKREIERRIIVPLARYLVSHRTGDAQILQVKRDGGEVQLFATSLTPARQVVTRADGPLDTGDGAAKLDLKDVIEGLAAVRLRLHDWAESDTVREIHNESKRLLAQTRKRDWTPHGPAAAKTWARIYHLERLAKRVEQLKDRADYLEEFATLSMRERYRSYEPELAKSYADLRRDADYLEIELLCAHLTESSQALLHLRAVGRAALQAAGEPWPLVLARTYLRWAKRKGYELAAFVPTPVYLRWLEAQGFAPKAYIPGFQPAVPPAVPKPAWAEVAVNDLNGLLKRLEALAPLELALALRGPNVYGFLKGEEGSHKLLLRGDDRDPSAPFQTAAVRVVSLEEDASPHAHLVAEWERAQAEKLQAGRPKADEAPEVVRLYSPDGDRSVRDLRTGLRTNQVRDFLDGELDAFILAYLKTAEAEKAWDEG